jgi:hypothetical protein
MGCRRDSFHRKALYHKGGEPAPQAPSRRKPVPKNRAAPEIGQTAAEPAIGQPALPRLLARAPAETDQPRCG